MPLKIIGPGFGRTGTNSLKLALEHLGFGPCHHMFEVRDNPELLADWEAAARGEPVDWDKVFRGYRSQVDWPGRDIGASSRSTFPKAKVILSVRDPDAWFDSVQATIAPFLNARGKHPSPHVNAIAEMAHETIEVQIFDDRMSERDHATRVFRETHRRGAVRNSGCTAFSLSICVTAGHRCASSSRSTCPRSHSPRQIRRRSLWTKSGSRSRPRLPRCKHLAAFQVTVKLPGETLEGAQDLAKRAAGYPGTLPKSD